MVPQFSIVLPTYNRAAYLGTALQSVFAQTVHDWQLVVVDDGSTDDTREVLGKIGDARAEVIYAEHRGQNRTIRTGVGVTVAPWVVFLSDDDELAPDALEHYQRAMDAGGDVLYGGCVVKWVDPVFGGTPGVDQYKPPEPANALPMHNVVWGVCFRRSMYDDLGDGRRVGRWPVTMVSGWQPMPTVTDSGRSTQRRICTGTTAAGKRSQNGRSNWPRPSR